MSWRKQTFGVLAGTGLVMVTVAPASAHELIVDNGNGDPKAVWVGAMDLPGKGQGLILGGPDQDWAMTPAHEKGLNSACAAQIRNGRSAAQIIGPPGAPKVGGVFGDLDAELCGHGVPGPPDED